MPESSGTSRRWDSSPTLRARLGGLLQRRRRGQPAGRLGSVRDLKEAIRTYIDGWNERCSPFAWTKDADTILAKSPASNYFASLPRH